ncbi:FliM/FliN family flagellar motor switch protein [Trinickia diaoshuihuensis]|jgi:flagellar motor switch protein FliN/FliY|uniref:FliM/FliN family flagellar motor switch protein n=1 Tax=Trinickia diaoshuihuensis TaxID=2292265 RepID=UPI000E22C4FB|nr:FliM/FliN family flagellar motor switch protein [Trinickia diaoshuihuensis]
MRSQPTSLMTEPTLDMTGATDLPAQASLVQLTELPRDDRDGAPLPLDTTHAGMADNPLMHIKAAVTVCVGTAELKVGELMSAREEQVVRLDQSVESPVDLLVGGQVIARGTLVVIDGCFGVRLTELPRPLKP